ncbi:transcription factor HES-3 [Spea bombifrons]|uniref:transcription factor HES-3 n=1 Tax=Spea bombifrons TaxID=233779 RepID=UPI00234A801B|nr:transcription factor HES-3 [Spea bombifrons]
MAQTSCLVEKDCQGRLFERTYGTYTLFGGTEKLFGDKVGTVKLYWDTAGTYKLFRGTDKMFGGKDGTISKPVMEKKRRTRINNSLEQLKTLLEKHYSYNVRKRKLEKADILELTVKYIELLQNVRQGMNLVDHQEVSEYKEGFKGCLTKLNDYLQRTKYCQDNLGLRITEHPNTLQSLSQVCQRPVTLLPKTGLGCSVTVKLEHAKGVSVLGSSKIPLENHMGSVGPRSTEAAPLHNVINIPAKLNYLENKSSESKSHQGGQRASQSFSTGHRGVNVSPPNPGQESQQKCWRPW